MGKFKRQNVQQADTSESNKIEKDSFFMKPKVTVEKKPRKVIQKDKNEGNTSANGEQIVADSKEESSKRPFDKKQWRLKKYSNKYKVEKWKEFRKKEILNQYHKVTKKMDNKGLDVQKIYERYDKEDSDLDEMNPVNSFEVKTKSEHKVSPSNEEIPEKAKTPKKFGPTSRKTKLQEIKEEKEKRREEFLKKKAEKEEALKLSKKKKAERYRRLNKRTKKGQPIMKDRMELLFEQVQRVCQGGE